MKIINDKVDEFIRTIPLPISWIIFLLGLASWPLFVVGGVLIYFHKKETKK